MIGGEKVSLRAVEREDIEYFYRWSNDTELRGLFGSAMVFCSRDQVREGFEDHGNPLNMYFTIVENDAKKPVGGCSLNDIDYINRSAVCSLYIGDRDNRGKGLGTEAMLLLERFAFMDLGLNRIGSKVFDFNNIAIRCYKSCGMKVEGIMRENLYRDGKWHDVYFMGILKREYEETIEGGDRICSEGNM